MTYHIPSVSGHGSGGFPIIVLRQDELQFTCPRSRSPITAAHGRKESVVSATWNEARTSVHSNYIPEAL